MNATKAEVVALFNTNPDLLDIVRLGLEKAGFIAVVGHVHDIRTGAVDLGPFIDQHRPRVIVYDLVMPYDRNWEFMKHVRDHPMMQGRQFVITTPNQRAARAVVGRDTSRCTRSCQTRTSTPSSWPCAKRSRRVPPGKCSYFGAVHGVRHQNL